MILESNGSDYICSVKLVSIPLSIGVVLIGFYGPALSIVDLLVKVI